MHVGQQSLQTHTYFCFVIVSAGMWTVQLTTGEKPPPVEDHTFTKIDHHRAVVCGGHTETGGSLNDAYILDMNKWVGRSMCVSTILVHTLWD